MNDPFIVSLVTFCALMENGDGILGKSPEYLREKFNRYVGNEGIDLTGLDSVRRAQVVAYMDRWKIESTETLSGK